MKKNTLLVALAVIMASFVACNNTEAIETPVTSEPASSSEDVSEEISEEVSVEPSEETEEIYELHYETAFDMVGNNQYKKAATIFECDFSQKENPQYMVPNGAHYTMQMCRGLTIIASREVLSFESNVDEVKIKKSAITNGDVWLAIITTTGTDIEVSATIKYTDGTEEDILLYVTNTFE